MRTPSARFRRKRKLPYSRTTPPALEQRESLTQRERRIIDTTLGMDEQLVLVTRPDPTILKVELLIHFGMAAY